MICDAITSTSVVMLLFVSLASVTSFAGSIHIVTLCDPASWRTKSNAIVKLLLEFNGRSVKVVVLRMLSSSRRLMLNGSTTGTLPIFSSLAVIVVFSSFMI